MSSASAARTAVLLSIFAVLLILFFGSVLLPAIFSIFLISPLLGAGAASSALAPFWLVAPSRTLLSLFSADFGRLIFLGAGSFRCPAARLRATTASSPSPAILPLMRGASAG